MMMRRPCIAVVSPFLDKRHGTERCVAEQAERLAREHGFEVHLFSQRVDDIPGVVPFSEWRAARQETASAGSLVWHRVSDAPGPQLVKYLWWFVANHFSRRRAGRSGVHFDLVYSPGINCFNADLMSVHIVFAEFVRLVRDELRLGRNALRFWPRLIHRRLYYRVLMALERRIYGDSRNTLVAVSRKVAADLERHCGRKSQIPVVYHGLDLARFNLQRRRALREASRASLGLSESDFAVLLVGNDFRKKGLRCLLEAISQMDSPRLKLLVVGEDDPGPFIPFFESLLTGRVIRFLPIRADVEFYYAAADIYAGPSLEDAFALPPAEAMACGVPAIVSRSAGVSEIITHGEDGLILEDAADAATLAGYIRSLMQDHTRNAMAGRAMQTAQRYTWDANVAEMKRLMLDFIAKREDCPSARVQ